jgi:predicted nucleic acid-binding protein
MVLADTSVWIAHFRRGEPLLAAELSLGRVLMHPFVRGGLACGALKNRASVLSDLEALPVAKIASTLWGQGLGWIDMHLLAYTLLSRCLIWTLDRRLAEAAKRLPPQR